MIDKAVHHEVFDALTDAIEGKPLLETLAAVQDLYVGMICLASDDRAAAVEMSELFGEDVAESVAENFDHYKSQMHGRH